MNRSLGLILLCVACAPFASAETRSAQDMAKECRVAIDVLQGRADQSLENTLLSGECIGYMQGAVDASLVMADTVCVPDNTSTMVMIQKFIAFVDKNPKYTLASTVLQVMLAHEFPCSK